MSECVATAEPTILGMENKCVDCIEQYACRDAR